MSKKDRLLSILEHSQQVLGAFVAGLSAEERAAVGTYEQWCPKDSVAHVAYWIEQRAARLAAVARGEEPPPLPAHYEQANAACSSASATALGRRCRRTWTRPTPNCLPSYALWAKKY